MAKTCAACRKAISNAQCMECSKCKETYHPLCVNIKETRKVKESNVDWMCPSCQCKVAKKGNLDSPARPSFSADDASDNVTLRPQNRKVASPSLQITGSTDIDAISVLTTEIRLLRKDMCEVKGHLKTLSDNFTKCCSRLDELEARWVTTDIKIKALEERELENCLLKQRVNQLEDQVISQAQITSQNEIEILGVNEVPNESTVHIALCTATKIGINLNEEDIDYVTRVGPRRMSGELESNSAKPRPVIVRFLRRTKRNEFLKAAKSRRTLSSADIDVAGPSRKLFFNERLTKAKRLLFRDARLRSGKAGYKYCWTRNGSIFIRKQEGSPAVPIRCVADLDRFCGPDDSIDAGKSQDLRL